nr:hypothetical protein [Tanacetum cinerariifolium]
MEYMIKNMFGLRWNCRELKEIVKLRFFRLATIILQRLKEDDTTRSTYLVNSSPSSTIAFKKPIDMLGFLSWLVSIKQGMLELVKVKCIFLGYHKSIVGNKLWRYREDNNKAAFVFTALEKIYTHELLTFNNTVACEVISKWKAGLKDDMNARPDVYVPINDDMVFPCGFKAEIWATKGLLDKAKGNVLGMEIVRDQSGYTRGCHGPGDCDVKENGKWSCIYAWEIRSIRWTVRYIASADVGMLDKFDRGLQTDVQVFVDFDYAMGRSITVMGG